ncbi:hypothetical protein BTJ49_04220 [Oleiagrimonas sp. MCCC 1A03011]|nr:hypothetical protein BTJ49_04220 [Oleiagrimonas sp. MCCC 1A03011]
MMCLETMMLRKLFLLAGILLSVTAQAGSMSCQKRYEVAVKQCKVLRGLCMDVGVCRHIREKCPQGVGTKQGCQAFGACTRRNTPPIFNNVCRYVWRESPAGGACKPNNAITERVAITCPGFNTKLPGQPAKSGALGQLVGEAGQYADATFSCSAQGQRFMAQREKCVHAIHYYYRGCATDPNRPTIPVPSCLEANALFGPVLKSPIDVTVHQAGYGGTRRGSILADRRLPLEWERKLGVEYDQKPLKVQITERGKGGSRTLYETTFDGRPGLRPGRELEVHVKLKVDKNNILTGRLYLVDTAKDKYTNYNVNTLAEKDIGPVHLDRPKVRTKPKENVRAASRPPRSDAASSRPAPAARAPVLKKTIGIVTQGGKFFPLIPATHRLPVTFADTFANAETNQKELEIQLAQKGEGEAKKFFDAVLTNLPPRPAGKLMVRIKIKVDAEKKLTLSANIPETGYYKEFGPFAVE